MMNKLIIIVAVSMIVGCGKVVPIRPSGLITVETPRAQFIRDGHLVDELAIPEVR